MADDTGRGDEETIVDANLNPIPEYRKGNVMGRR
jgi:hypothetical protein